MSKEEPDQSAEQEVAILLREIDRAQRHVENIALEHESRLDRLELVKQRLRGVIGRLITFLS